MFERYTEAARRAMFFSRYAVSRHGGDAIAPEHLLIGLLPRVTFSGLGLQEVDVQQATTAAALLRGAGVTLDAVTSQIEPRTSSLPTSVEIPFSASAKRCLEDAMREADQMGARPITTGHLLLGLLQADGTAAAAILHDAGLHLNAARIQVEADVAGGVEGDPPPALPNKPLA